jgi:hypothetical protein
LILLSVFKEEKTIGRTVTGDLSKSADLARFQKKSEKNHILQHSFGKPAPNRG